MFKFKHIINTSKEINKFFQNGMCFFKYNKVLGNVCLKKRHELMSLFFRCNKVFITNRQYFPWKPKVLFYPKGHLFVIIQ